MSPIAQKSEEQINLEISVNSQQSEVLKSDLGDVTHQAYTTPGHHPAPACTVPSQ